MRFDRNVATRLPPDLLQKLESEAKRNYQTLAAVLRRLVAEHYREPDCRERERA